MNTQQVLSRVALAFEVEPAQLQAGSRSTRLVQARQAAAWMLYFNQRHSYSDIAAALGYRDHSTAVWAVQAAANRAKRDQDYSDKLGQIARM
ncbi:hypothetical protein K2Z83_04585 [Oscillochloris sp. ZM17-4]|uniref:helix-turn-helix domain-containing protein n=1 Tax=Oscillochloris sp. ZM17-4 TaxID=2866714 RepID=UPI001C735786|nr:hypothetical protein [Oscillochloris sp. ZM17-4]